MPPKITPKISSLEDNRQIKQAKLKDMSFAIWGLGEFNW